MDERSGISDAQKAEFSQVFRALSPIDPYAVRAELRMTEGGDLEQAFAIVDLVEIFEPKDLTAHPHFQYAWGSAIGETIWNGVLMSRPDGILIEGQIPAGFDAWDLNPVRTMALEFNRAIINTQDQFTDPDMMLSPSDHLHLYSVDHMLFHPRMLEAYPDLSFQRGILERLIQHAKDKPVLSQHYQLVLEKLDEPGYVESRIPDEHGFLPANYRDFDEEEVCPPLVPLTDDEKALLKSEYKISMEALGYAMNRIDLLLPYFLRNKHRLSPDDWRTKAKEIEAEILISI